MNAVALILKRIPHGWVIALSDGREVARFTGPAAKRRALRYIASDRVAKERARG